MQKVVSCRSLGHRAPLSSKGLAVLPKLVGPKAGVSCRGDATLGLLDAEYARDPSSPSQAFFLFFPLRLVAAEL